MPKSKKVSDKTNTEIKTVLNNLIKKNGGAPTSVCKELSKEAKVSFVTLYNIAVGKAVCTERTYDFLKRNTNWFNKQTKSKTKTVKDFNNKVESYAEGHKVGFSKGYEKGKREGIKTAEFLESAAYQRGYSDGRNSGPARTARPSGYSSQVSSHKSKFEKLMKLNDSTDSAGESTAAKVAASKVLNKMLAEHPDFRKFNLNVNIN